MRGSYLGAGVLAVALLLAAAGTGLKADESEFRALFNGQDLSGWSGDEALWRVENGEIVGSTHGVTLEKNTFLAFEEEFDDFVLKLKVKLINGNSGIQFRSDRHPEHVMGGYQADVAEKTYFGMLYEEKKRGILPYWNELNDEERAAIHDAGKLGEWNEYEITCKGDRVKMVLNGKTTLDFEDPDGAKQGYIGLQLHTGPEMEVRFKDIEIKVLEKKKA